MLGLRRSQPHRNPNPRGVGSGSQIGMTGLYVVEHKMICIFFFSLKSNNSQVLPVLRGKERKNKTKQNFRGVWSRICGRYGSLWWFPYPQRTLERREREKQTRPAERLRGGPAPLLPHGCLRTEPAFGSPSPNRERRRRSEEGN